MNKDEILKILTDWNYWGSYQDQSVVRRNYLNRLSRLIKTGEIVVVKGVRRSGKSTIVAQFINHHLINKGLKPKNTLIVNFEDPRFRKLNLSLLNQIYEIYLQELLPDKNHYVILDEVQEIQGWEKFARFLSEAKKLKVLVTGSSSKLLSEEYATLLSGRRVDLEIFPLSFQEFLQFKGIAARTKIAKIKTRHKIQNLLNEYLEFGAFPKVALVEKNEKMAILRSYFEDILIKDVQRRFKIREVKKLEELAKYYLTNMTALQSFNRVKNVIGLSLDSVERFSHYFSIARLFFLVPKFSFSLKTQILNPKKIYGIDLGLRNAIGFKFSQDLGKAMENLVFVEFFRRNKQVFYWRSPSGKEVDFLVKNGTKIEELIQVCYQLDEPNIKEREIKALLQAAKELKCSRLKIITFDYDAEENIQGKKLKFISLRNWLLE